jgi:RimJ/RimL family protein N-acetyltransferase
MECEIFVETPRLILRNWLPSDNEPYIAMNQDKEVMEFFPSLLTAEQSMAHIQSFKERICEFGYTFFAVERKDNGEFIGFTGLSRPGFEAAFTPCVEIGWRLSRPNWGQGFATEAAIASLKFGFEDLKLDTIYSFTSVHNKRSEHVMEKIGMKKEGYFDHPLIKDGHILKKHVLYKIVAGE